MDDYRSKWEIDAERWARAAKTSELIGRIVRYHHDRRDRDYYMSENEEAQALAAEAEIDRRIPGLR